MQYSQVPVESEYGVSIVQTIDFCCGRSYLYYSPGGNCIFTELRNPENQERLAELALSSDLLVADCRGRYVPYGSPTTAMVASTDPVLLRDRRLR